MANDVNPIQPVPQPSLATYGVQCVFILHSA